MMGHRQALRAVLWLLCAALVLVVLVISASTSSWVRTPSPRSGEDRAHRDVASAGALSP